MSHENGTFSIAALASEYDVTARTIRHYEDLGLLSPERRGTARVFHQRDRVRLALILRGRRIGFSLDEISTIVNMYDEQPGEAGQLNYLCLLYTSDAADDLTRVDLGGRRI